MIDLAFYEDDHLYRRLGAVAQNQRNRHAFDMAQPRAAGSERPLGRPVGKCFSVESAVELLRNFFWHRPAELRRGDLMDVSAVAFLDRLRKIEISRSREKGDARSDDERGSQCERPKRFELRKRRRRNLRFNFFPERGRSVSASQESAETLVEFCLILQQTGALRT